MGTGAMADLSQALDTKASVEDTWNLIPPAWRQFYKAPARLEYDVSRYDFLTPVREMLECPDGVPLSRLHEVHRPADFDPCPPLRKGMVLAGMKVAPEGQGSKKRNRNKKDWYQSPAYLRFFDAYRLYLREQVIPSLGAIDLQGKDLAEVVEAVVQSCPVLRVVFPAPRRFTETHRDADYGHVPEELNYWIPLTPVFDNNTLHCETFPRRGDCHRLEGENGHAFRCWLNQCEHWTVPNDTNSTRVSFEFRVVPRSLWNSREAQDAAQNRTRKHLGELRIGSYYFVEQGLARSSSDQPPSRFCSQSMGIMQKLARIASKLCGGCREYGVAK
eukprot:TRINITY_DN16801_c0_g1_i1.p1 TRINITY_DN16801_c0_g1~~TRINITY_DN16801_c0_g1_i1.p1  ORF type:complete len:330 (-),score=23.26 TRINITY_DN16801_c0_g1_i1:67-1056(-)